jgi:uncharacterized membrane protein
MQEAEYQSYGLSRLISFSDDVFAFAITLLVIAFAYPALPSSLSAGQFFAQLFTLKDSFISFLVSFYIVGFFWLSHHQYFRYISKFDTGLFLINLTLLLCIAFLPFPTYLVGHYGDRSIVAAFYAAMLTLMSVLYLLLWWNASSRHRLIPPTVEQNVITYECVKRLVQISIFVISIGLALITLYLAIPAWIAAGLIYHFVPMGRRTSIRKGDS